MKNYEDIPSWWFYILLALSMIVSLILCTVLKDQVQLPWWGLLFACAMAFVFTLPISIITATTNQVFLLCPTNFECTCAHKINEKLRIIINNAPTTGNNKIFHSNLCSGRLGQQKQKQNL
jgi:OPT oligopeptide transporter protein